MNFFDAMGMADKERIHSQFIFWFFNLDEKIVSDKIKSKILEAFLPDLSFSAMLLSLILFNDEKDVSHIEKNILSPNNASIVAAILI